MQIGHSTVPVRISPKLSRVVRLSNSHTASPLALRVNPLRTTLERSLRMLMWVNVLLWFLQSFESDGESDARLTSDILARWCRWIRAGDNACQPNLVSYGSHQDPGSGELPLPLPGHTVTHHAAFQRTRSIDDPNRARSPWTPLRFLCQIPQPRTS